MCSIVVLRNFIEQGSVCRHDVYAAVVRQGHVCASLIYSCAFCVHFSIDTSKPKCFVLSSCCELDSGNTLSQCRITGALEGTQFRLVVRQLSLQLPTTMAEGEAGSYM